MASGSQPPVTRVPIFWDFENSWELEKYNIEELKSYIETSLQTLDSSYVVDDKIIAVGPGGNNPNYNRIAASAHIKVVEIPWENLRCEAKEGQCRNLVVTNRNINYEQTMRKTDAAEKYLAMEIYMKVLDGYKNFLVISRNADFLSVIDSLNKRRMFMMLATDKLTDDAIKSAKAIWLWGDMIRGGRYVYKR